MNFLTPRAVLVGLTTLALLSTPACSPKKYAINMVGVALASGNSVYETDEDIQLVGEALPFGLKLVESLLLESPEHRGLLSTASQGFVLYSFAYVDYPAEVMADVDLDRAQEMRARARKLYLRALGYGLRGLERSYPGFTAHLATEPQAAAARIHNHKKEQLDLPFLYWSAAALGLAISSSRNNAAMLARLPEVEALVDRALELDEAWDGGAFHEFQVTVAGAKPTTPDRSVIDHHYQRALGLSEGKRAGLYVAYAEVVSIPDQNRAQFRSLLDKALAVDPDTREEDRLVNLLAHRRAKWLLDRIDELFFEEEEPKPGVTP